jgi:hypothetical protein
VSLGTFIDAIYGATGEPNSTAITQALSFFGDGARTGQVAYAKFADVLRAFGPLQAVARNTRGVYSLDRCRRMRQSCCCPDRCGSRPHNAMRSLTLFVHAQPTGTYLVRSETGVDNVMFAIAYVNTAGVIAHVRLLCVDVTMTCWCWGRCL